MEGFIYKITNKVNGKSYIGQTRNTVEFRWRQHYKAKDNKYFHRAIQKYGKENFEVTTLEKCDVEKLNDREIYYINKYNTFGDGYNLTKGGQNSNYFNLHKLEDTVDIKKFEQYILEFKPLATEVAKHFGICKCSVYNLIKRLNNPNLILNSYNPRKGKSIEDIDKEELIRLYNDGWSIIDLVKKYHIKKTKVSKFLRKSGIKIRRGIKGYKHRI